MNDIWAGDGGPEKYLCPWCDFICDTARKYTEHARLAHPKQFALEPQTTYTVSAVDTKAGIVTIK